MCECAAMGMPVVTSSLSICREMLDRFPNVAFVSRGASSDEVEAAASAVASWRTHPGNEALYAQACESLGAQSTVEREIALLRQHV